MVSSVGPPPAREYFTVANTEALTGVGVGVGAAALTGVAAEKLLVVAAVVVAAAVAAVANAVDAEAVEGPVGTVELNAANGSSS